MSALRRTAELLPRAWLFGRLPDSSRIPRVRPSKDRAVEVARTVLRYEQAAISITPSETILLAREYLRALGLREVA